MEPTRRFFRDGVKWFQYFAKEFEPAYLRMQKKLRKENLKRAFTKENLEELRKINFEKIKAKSWQLWEMQTFQWALWIFVSTYGAYYVLVGHINHLNVDDAAEFHHYQNSKKVAQQSPYDTA
eukprot:Platyproteum_vivax@DN16839_c0_g1_i1.p1